MKAVEQKIWRGGTLNREMKKDFKLKKIEKMSFKWLVKARFSIRDIVIIVVLILLIRYFAVHLSIHLNWS